MESGPRPTAVQKQTASIAVHRKLTMVVASRRPNHNSSSVIPAHHLVDDVQTRRIAGRGRKNHDRRRFAGDFLDLHPFLRLLVTQQNLGRQEGKTPSSNAAATVHQRSPPPSFWIGMIVELSGIIFGPDRSNHARFCGDQLRDQGRKVRMGEKSLRHRMNSSSSSVR